ncbi:MAG: dihydrofolate reductase [Candidatus Cloacimonetes bacterium]|nr:dihydrofolate reductase [Candidatus Cloacimonadota bacterium]
MRNLNIIVAVDNNWAIGSGGDLQIKIPEDMKYFKSKTINNIVIMGRKTFESLPGQKPLKDRFNIVLSNTMHTFYELIVCKDINEVFNLVSVSDKEIFVIGGEQIYKLFLPYCHKAFVTKIYHSFTADKFFPNLDQIKEWSVTSESNLFYTKEGIGYRFLEYMKG